MISVIDPAGVFPELPGFWAVMVIETEVVPDASVADSVVVNWTPPEVASVIPVPRGISDVAGVARLKVTDPEEEAGGSGVIPKRLNAARIALVCACMVVDTFCCSSRTPIVENRVLILLPSVLSEMFDPRAVISCNPLITGVKADTGAGKDTPREEANSCMVFMALSPKVLRGSVRPGR